MWVGQVGRSGRFSEVICRFIKVGDLGKKRWEGRSGG